METVSYEEAVGRMIRVTGGVNEGREGRVRGYDGSGYVIIRDKDNMEIFVAHDTEVEVYM